MLKKFLFITILIVLSIPLLDTLLGGIFPNDPLGGDYKTTTTIPLSWDNFLSGNYQKKQSKACNDQLNLHSTWVRLYNQGMFSCFGEANLYNGVIGKDNYLFDKSYIQAYYGDDFVGKNKATQQVEVLQKLQKILKFYGKKLAVCFLPGKPSFYPDKIPDHLVSTPKMTNTTFYSQALSKTGIPVLNLNDFFMYAKDTAGYCLYPKYGIHLSSYGTVLAADTLVKFIEALTQKDLPNPIITNITTTNQLRHYDDDIYKSLNLLMPLEMDTLAYPDIAYTAGSSRCRVLTIGDSFYKYIFDSGIHSKAFDQGSFWFYAKKVWPLSTQKDVKNLDIRSEIINNDVVLLFASEATLYRFPYGINKDIPPLISPLNKDWHYVQLAEHIQNNAEWQSNIRQKAAQDNISFEEQQKKEIDFFLEAYIKKQPQKDQKLYQYIEYIKGHDEWFNSIKNNAISNQKNLNEALYLDALYYYNQQQK